MTDAMTVLPFPHPTLTKVNGEPNASSICTLQHEIYANAKAISTGLGGGNYRYLAHVMPPMEYNALPNMAPFVVPLHPGAHPGHTTNTVAVITETNRLYAESVKNHEKFTQVDAEIKKQLLQAVDDIYWKALKDRLLGYGNVTIRNMIDHLLTTYGTITPVFVCWSTCHLE